jgi:hypothetical protein
MYFIGQCILMITCGNVMFTYNDAKFPNIPAI